MEQIIQLAADDDITSIKSRLEWTDARRLLLIIPRKNKTLRSLVHLKILARTASMLNIELALVTQDLQIRDAAKQAKVKIYAAEWMARRAGFISTEVEKTGTEETTPPQLQLVEAPAVSRMRIKNKKLVVVVGKGWVNFLEQFLALILAGVLALALVVVVLAFAPIATITLTPTVERVSTQLTLTANPTIGAIDRENNIIPAEPIQVEVTIFAEVDTVDTDVAPVDLAQGSVVIFNRTQDEQFVPISTTVRTSSGVPIEFRTTQDAVVPAGPGKTVRVPIRAVEPGPIGNISEGQISRFTNPTLGLLLRVVNDSGTFGGTTRQAKVVTEDDKDAVRAKLRQLIQQQGYEQMLQDLPQDVFIPPESLQVIELNLTYDKFSGDVADKLGAEMQAVVRGTLVSNFQVNDLAQSYLLREVPSGKTLLLQSLQFKAGGIEDIADRTVSFSVIVDGIVVTQINEDIIREQIVFQPIGEAQQWLTDNLDIVTVPGVEVNPNWLGRLPVFATQINVEVTDVNDLIFGDLAEAEK